MLRFLIGNTVFAKALLTACILGVISFVIMEISYRSMIRASGQIGKTKKKWLVSLKKRYEDYHEMNVKVNNVETFVDRLFRKKRMCGLPCGFWQTLYRLSIAACAIIGAGGALIASQRGDSITQVMVTYLTGITAAGCLLFFYLFLRPEEKIKAIIVNMNDYLENVLENTICGEESIESVGVQREHRRRLVDYARENAKKQRKSKPVSPEEEKLLEDILQEFFA